MKDMTDENLSKVFDIEKIEDSKDKDIVKMNDEEPVKKLPMGSSDDNDFDYARDNILNIVDKMEENIELAKRIAEETGDPKAISALTSAINGYVDINKKLLDLHQQKAKINKSKNSGKSSPTTVHNTQNIVFSGTTAEMQKQLQLQENMLKNNIIEGKK